MNKKDGYQTQGWCKGLHHIYVCSFLYKKEGVSMPLTFWFYLVDEMAYVVPIAPIAPT